MRGNSKHHLRTKGENTSIKTSKHSSKSESDSSDVSSHPDYATTTVDMKSLKQICESEDLNEIPDWFSKSKNVRLQTCFPNAFDPKYLMARRKLFKQMKLLKEEQEATKNKNSSSIIKLTPCAPPSFAKNLKFKPIKGHVVKPAEKSAALTSVSADVPNKIPQDNINELEDAKSAADKYEKNKESNAIIVEVREEESNLHKEASCESKKVMESQKDISDIHEEEKPKNRRSRRKV